MRYFLVILLSLGWIYGGIAQSTRGKKKAPTTVYLKDGSIFRGEIIRYEIGSEMKLKVSEQATINIPASVIEKVIQEEPKVLAKEEFPGKFSGFYNATNVYLLEGFLAGNRESGLGIQNSTGYRWNHWLGAGIGFGYDNYEVGNRLATIPIFAEMRGQFIKAQTAPFYTIQMGYAFGLKDEDQNIFDSQGGWLFHPAVGILFNNRNETNAFSIDVGYRFQKLSYRQESFWNNDFDDFKIVHKRLSVKLGMVF